MVRTPPSFRVGLLVYTTTTIVVFVGCESMYTHRKTGPYRTIDYNMGREMFEQGPHEKE